MSAILLEVGSPAYNEWMNQVIKTATETTLKVIPQAPKTISEKTVRAMLAGEGENPISLQLMQKIRPELKPVKIGRAYVYLEKNVIDYLRKGGR